MVEKKHPATLFDERKSFYLDLPQEREKIISFLSTIGQYKTFGK